MALEYRNRRGDLYTIFQGVTKSGKSKYYASKSDYSDSGDPVDELPDGFEIAESPVNATVSVRRRKPTNILPSERELISKLVLELTSFSVEQTVIEGNSLVVYTPDSDPVLVHERMKRLFGSSPKQDSWTARHTRFTAMLRFTLSEKDTRVFSVERYCFRGSVDRWIPITYRGPLETVARKVIPTLDKENFYELF